MNHDSLTKLIVGDFSLEKYEFSIIIPTYKRPKYLRQTIYSALNQVNYSGNYEIIIVNNDNSECIENKEIHEIVNNCKNEKIPIRYYENKKNLGQYGNWMLGIQLASSEWVIMCHDDDLMSSRILECYHKVLTEKKYNRIGYIRPNFVCGNVENLEKLNKQIDKKIYTLKLEEITYKDFVISGSHAATAPPTCGTLINKKLALDIGKFNNESFPAGDAQFVFDLSKRCRIYRTISHMGAYGVGINETLSFGMKKKFVDIHCIQLRELRKYGKKSSLFLDFFDSAILYKCHRIRDSFWNNIHNYDEVPISHISLKIKLKIILYEVCSRVFFITKKIWSFLF